MGCKTRSVGSTELKNVPHLSSRATDAQIKNLDAPFPGGEQISNLKRPLLS